MIEPLRHFVLIVDHGTFTAASRQAHVSQPALTASIHRLEASLDARLFDRGRHGATLTEAGRALVPHARAIVVALEEGARAVRDVETLEGGEVKIGGGSTACTYYLPPVLSTFRKRHPKVRIYLRELSEDAALTAFENGELDLVVVRGKRGDLFRADEVAARGARRRSDRASAHHDARRQRDAGARGSVLLGARHRDGAREHLGGEGECSGGPRRRAPHAECRRDGSVAGPSVRGRDAGDADRAPVTPPSSRTRSAVGACRGASKADARGRARAAAKGSRARLIRPRPLSPRRAHRNARGGRRAARRKAGLGGGPKTAKAVFGGRVCFNCFKPAGQRMPTARHRSPPQAAPTPQYANKT